MSSTTSNLTNVNFMSEARYNNLLQVNDDELYAVKVDLGNNDTVLNQNTEENPIKFWTGTQEEYDELVNNNEIDADTLYNIKNGTANPLDLFKAIYPVGSIYIGIMPTCPMSALFGTWSLVSTGRVLQGSDANHVAGSTIAAGLPNITGGVTDDAAKWLNLGKIDAFYGCVQPTDTDGGYPQSGSLTSTASNGWSFDASRSSSVYGNSDTVQPPAFVVNIWQRIA